jgi:2,3-bisphosphoglycerate-independent phosphoglycerate mutase
VVSVLVIPDGAAEPLTAGRSTSLERACTPTLDALCAAGAVRRVAITPQGRAPGSETGIPLLLGAPVNIPASRGLLEAAAAGLDVPPGTRAWRVDLHTPDGGRAGAEAVRAAGDDLRRHLPHHELHHLRGHRYLAIGLTAPAVPSRLGALVLRTWGDGGHLRPHLDEATVMVSGPGAAAGAARLLGARLVRPAGATGGPDTDLAAKRDAALSALAQGAARVIVHVGAPDEAAHALDAPGKVAALEAVDGHVLAPLWEAVARRGGRLAVCPDHGTDPQTGAHDARPVPAVCAGAGVSPDCDASARMTERDALDRPVMPPAWLEEVA